MNKRQIKKQQKKIMKFIRLAEDAGVNIIHACKTDDQVTVYDDCMCFCRNYKNDYCKLNLTLFKQIQKNIVDIMINDIEQSISEYKAKE